ncbi:MAG: hypothetical protein R2939_00610 [Kofleriaceae bacterium]
MSSGEPAPDHPRRRQLLGWIADSERRQRRLRVVTAAGGVLGLGALAIDRTVGLMVLGATATISIVTYWVTAAHIADWRQQLEHLARTGRVR